MKAKWKPLAGVQCDSVTLMGYELPGLETSLLAVFTDHSMFGKLETITCQPIMIDWYLLIEAKLGILSYIWPLDMFKLELALTTKTNYVRTNLKPWYLK